MTFEFYELKYRILETFYNVLYEEKYSYSQAADRTYSEFYQEIQNHGIEYLIIATTIGKRLLMHHCIPEYHIEFIKKAFALYQSTNLTSELKEYEAEVLHEEIKDLKIELEI